jgi:filamentous hemagglutinin family protein
MNCIYRIVWSHVSNSWVAVAENVRGRGKSTNGPRLVAAALALAGASWGMPSAYAADAANAAVSAGTAGIATVGNTTTINQGSQRVAIDWTSLSTRANEALVFNQPNAQAIALNRITGSSPSELLGSLTANGQVFILNPNGVLFGAGSQVNVGGLVASTLNISNADFMAGNHVLTGSGGSGSVVNQGTLNAGQGGYLALLAPEVRNEGVMTASLGTALLAAGNKVTLNLDNGSLLGYSIDQGAINALAENRHLIQANGGQVLLSAKAMDSLTTATVNNTGVIEAKTLQNKAGRILLMGDMETGTVNVGGTLDASAPSTDGMGGDGGFVETSAAHVNVAEDARVTTRAAAGKTGQWLIDPFDFVVASTGGNMTGAALGSQLDNTNVTLATTAGNTGTDGDLSINDAVSWSAANTLTLVGERDVNVNANLAYSGSGTAGVTVQAVRDINVGAGVAIASTGTGALPVVFGGATVGTAAGGAISMGSGSSIATTGGDVNFKAAAIKLAGASVAAAGGNIAMTAAGTSASHSLEITNVGGARSNVSTTGAGAITLSGSLTGGGASATGGSAGGVVVTSSSITSDTGTISITGSAGGASTGSQVERGFRLDSGTLVTSAGNISMTGSVAGNQALPSGIPSMGGEVANGATVSSTGGNVTLSGTMNNASHFTGTGLTINGKVQTGAAGKVALTGAATVGVAAGTGLSTGLSSEIIAGTGGLDITGTVSSATTATSLSAVVLAGAASATGNIAVTGTTSAPSASGVRSLDMQAGTLTGLGAATITLKGSGVPAPAPAASYDVNVFGTTVSTAGGEITLTGDRVRVDSSINSGSGRTVITSFSVNRAITLGGSDETNSLNLSNSEINNITASVLRLGSSTARGGISIGNGGGAINMTGIQTLSLVNSSTLGAGITQSAGFTVANLNADARTVTLTNAANQIGQVSGRSYAGAFQVSSSASLSVGTVDGAAGINSGANATVLASLNGAIAGTQAVTAGSLNASARDGITLSTNVSGSQTLSTSGAAGNISITGSNALDTGNFSITTDGASVQTISLSSGNGITVGSAFGNSQDKLKLIATGGNIAVNGALTASELTLSTGGTSSQTAAITATGLELLGSGTHTLNNAGNAVAMLAGNTGNVDYSQAGALAVGTVNTVGLTTSGKVLVRATGAAGDITLNNTVTSGSAASDSLVLAAGRNFINNAGATPLNPGAGRFLVYSTDPAANSFGGFASTGNAFSRSYAANAPTDASMTSISGNRMVYSVTPVINITGDNQAKVYGAADPTLTYTVGSGLVAGDTAGSVLAGLLSAPAGSAASAGTHAITQGSLSAALGYGIAYTSGTLTVGKATVSVTGAAANNKTYDGSAAATLGNIGSLTGLAYGEALTLNLTGATFADANAGAGKTVTATYSLSNGTGLASNYQLAAAPVTTTANIAKANLSVTANNDSRTVGAAPYAGGNGVSFSGFVGGETAAVLGGTLAYGGSSQGASAVGSYAITASGYSAANYTLAYVDGVLTINPVVVPPAPVVPTAPTVPTVLGGGIPANDAYLSAMYTLAKVGGSGGEGAGGGLAGNGADPSDALRAAAAEAGNTDEAE